MSNKTNTVQIHTYYNSVVPNTDVKGTPKLDSDGKPVLNRNNEIVMKYPPQLGKDGKSLYSENIFIVFKAESTVPDSLSLDRVKHLATTAESSKRTLKHADTAYNVAYVSPEYEMKDGDTTVKVIRAKYEPQRAKFRPELSW
jgi:hypothetical protein